MMGPLKKFTPARIWLLSIVISVIVTECIVAGAGILLIGEVSYGYLLDGFIASVLVAGLAGGFWNFSRGRQRQREENLHIAAILPEVQADRGGSDAEAKKDAGNIPPAVPVPHDSAERPTGEAPMRKRHGRADLMQALKNLDALPAMPLTAQKLLALRLDTEEGERRLLMLIEQDPQISARILGLANSAMVGASRQIKSVRDAEMLLGSKRVQSVATGIAIMSLMAKVPTGELNMQDLWLHSFGIAFAMQGIARFMPEKIRPEDDHIFLAGMLHDIGYLALAFLDPKLSDKLHNYLSAQPDRPSMEVECEVLEVCHDELGAELARHWNLPEEIIIVLRYHHNPDAAEAAAGQPLVRMVNIAGKLLPSFGIVEYMAPDISAGEWAALGIDPSKAEEVKAQVGKQVELAIQLSSSFT